jgi:hypothetical protein
MLANASCKLLLACLQMIFMIKSNYAQSEKDDNEQCSEISVMLDKEADDSGRAV